MPVVLGRSSRADLTIDDALLSRKHSEIRVNESGQFEIHDLESTNLTIVNERDVTSHVLRPGDRILLGDTIIDVVVDTVSNDFNEQTTREIDTLTDGGPR